MSYHANIASAQFLLETIMPLVWRERPEIKVWIVGKNPAGSIKSFDRNPRVTVTGYVSEMAAYLCKVAIAVVPLVYGAGIQNKVLEAMACGTPVIANRKATAALDCAAGRDFLLASDPQEFSRAILELLQNPKRRDELSQAGREYVQNYHSWDAVARRLEGLYGLSS
jgi:glycosyltransferase involved in cell wall biosynthesis